MSGQLKHSPHNSYLTPKVVIDVHPVSFIKVCAVVRGQTITRMVLKALSPAVCLSQQSSLLYRLEAAALLTYFSRRHGATPLLDEINLPPTALFKDARWKIRNGLNEMDDASNRVVRQRG